jgi:hypothetical protein
MLSWGGASDQIKNASSLARDLSFLLLGLESPFDLCYWVRRPQLSEKSAKCLMIWKDHWSWMNPSHHLGLLGWVRVYICSDVVDFLKSSRTDLVIGLVLIAIATGSEVTNFLRLLKLIWRSDSSMITITARSEVTDFLRLLRELDVDRRRASRFLFVSRVLKIIVVHHSSYYWVECSRSCSEQELHAHRELLVVDPWCHEFTRTNLSASPLPGAPLSTSSHQILGVRSEGMQVGEINLMWT